MAEKTKPDYSVICQRAALIGALILPLIILVLLPRGVEFTDTGFYYNAFFNLHEIDMQTTQFSVVWSIFSFSDSFLLHRLLTFSFLFFAAYFFFRSADSFHLETTKSTAWRRVTYGALAGLTIVPYYNYWIPDPSYDSLGYTLAFVVFGLGFGIAKKLSQSLRTARNDLILLGFVMIPLFYARPTAPLVCAVFIAPIVLLSAHSSFITLAKALGYFAAGLFTYIIVQTIFIEPLWDSVSRIEGGFLRRELLGRGNVLGAGFEQFRINSRILLLKYSLEILALSIIIAGFICKNLVQNSPRRHYKTALTAVIVVAIIFVLIQNLKFIGTYIESWDQRVSLSEGSFVLFAGLLGAFTLAIGVGMLSEKSSYAIFKRSALAISVIGISMASFLGTSGDWVNHLYIYSGVFPAMIILLAPRKTKTDRIIFTAIMGCAVIISIAPMKNMVQFPYRLPDSLFAQTHKTENVRGMSFMRVDSITRKLMEDIALARPKVLQQTPRPALIDLSGRLPMTAYLLQASTPRSAWVLSNYPGSQDLFDFTYDSIEPDVLKAAWILESPKWEYSMNSGILAQKGINFPSDYDLIMESWSPYLNANIKLWAPKTAEAISSDSE